jgi:hypothetical protein
MPNLAPGLLLAGLSGFALSACGTAIAASPTAPPDAAQTRQTLRVGPGQALAVPSEAVRLAKDGALVEIEASDYRGDVAVWPQHGITLRGINGRARLDAAGQAAEAKAIWVIKGDLVEVENLEFSGTRVPDRNGAGIRAEGASLTIRNCRFHHNEIGLLTSNATDAVLLVQGSEFDHNTTGPLRRTDPGHNIYVGRIRRFTLSDSHVHGGQVGHQVKSRAWRNVIRGNRILDGSGAGSYLIDLPNGGEAEIAGNTLGKAALAPNRTAIAFASEANRGAPGQSLRVLDNVYRVFGNPGVFVTNHSGAAAELIGNRISGGAVPLDGKGKVR